MIIYNLEARKVIDGKYYANLFEEKDRFLKDDYFRKCYFYIAKELVKDDASKLIEKLFNQKYSFEKYMKDMVNVIYFSPKEEDEDIFIKSLKIDFDLENVSDSINIQKY